MNRFHLLCIGVVLASIACQPVRTTRIGPPPPAKAAGCDIEVLPPGEVPVRPFRDVAMLFASHCPDYTRPPCRQWVIDAACAAGGSVVYLRDDVHDAQSDGRDDTLQGPVSFQLSVGAYASFLPPANGEAATGSPTIACPTTPDDADHADPDFGVCKETP
ncbi:MAG: hypothetical protein M0R76_01210 [Proteobacteria bacterium]|nr:hypothetical protein [Pseudomonadota bacterium]